VVFIVGDNVGWGDLGCYGGLASTPRIDTLAGQGMRFKNYNVEAQCTPSDGRGRGVSPALLALRRNLRLRLSGTDEGMPYATSTTTFPRAWPCSR
jgi:Sulfatase